MHSRRFRFVPQVDCLSRRIVLDAAAAGMAIPMIADGSQDGSSATGNGSDASKSVDPGANTSSANASATDSALNHVASPDSSDDSQFDPNSTGVLDDSEFTSCTPVSGVCAY
jgi:hypothetical protein